MQEPGPAGAPHHDGSPLYVANQAPALGDVLALRLRVPASWGTAVRVFLRSLRDGEAHYDEAGSSPGDAGWSWWEAQVRAVNPALRYRFLLEVADGDGTRWMWLNARGASSRDTPDRDDFRIDCRPAPADWARNGVVYQVFPDRFARSGPRKPDGLPGWAVACAWNDPVEPRGELTPRQIYGGDLDGIIGKLDHLVALGVTVLYVTPFFPARSNHRYDATTFDVVDPLLGGDDALVRLVRAAHARNISVIGDLTANHTGDAHEWFLTALADPTSVEAGFYYFTEDHTDYACWFGVPSLPKLDWASPELRRRFVEGPDSVVARWLLPPFSLDGWRIDVANMTGRHGDVDLNTEVAHLIRATMDAVRPGLILLAESTGDATENLAGQAWDGAMTYSNLTRPLWQWLARGDAAVNFFGTPLPGVPRIGGGDVVATHVALSAGFSWRMRTQNMSALNTHDTARAGTVMIDGGPAVGIVLIFLLPGLPTLFAGDEFGLRGVNGEDSRAPMPWDASAADRPDDLRPLIAALSVLRAGSPALREGAVRWLAATDDVIVLAREHEQECFVIAAARADYDGVPVPLNLLPGPWADAEQVFLGVPGAKGLPEDGVLVLSGQGPGVQAWRFPGLRLP
ncbi:alpha-amylase family glycosyl hydrolase [Arthrobacter sp. Br18]|uniref:alpha-amylase family glycosyl hydrolase n=1 Tax=Arthrobacter sp. Br18 TaxID=1312954 RepID=UPI0004B484CD|nr:alpha-amylase family glycosyl hydrolase [Arthrobacter sp. Br18]